MRVDARKQSGLELLEPFSLEAVLASDPEYVTRVDVTLERKIPDGSGYFICGEGSYGSEGLFGRLDADKSLVWIVYLEDGNPFIDVIVESTSAIFTSSSGLTVKVDLGSSSFGL